MFHFFHILIVATYIVLPAASARLAQPATAKRDAEHLSESFDEMVERRVKFLAAYQGAGYAGEYRALVDRVKDAEAVRTPGKCGLAVHRSS